MIDNDPLIGKQLANFLVERLLGRGGMAQVYYGHDVKLQRPVAIKVIDSHYRYKPGYAERFVKEARSVAKWRHQNIIQIYYADDADDLYYYVMEYIGGHDLSSVMASYTGMNELMPFDEILRIGRAVASALDYAHQQGIIHRDVKPSNVLMSEDGRVVLGDFGLALDVQEGSIGEIFGTPHYISPEQAVKSKDVVPQSDLYALGVILYEMLTGTVPFDDPSPTSVALQHCTQAPPAPRSINPNISEETEQVILKALSKKPSERYQTGSALMDALEKTLIITVKPATDILPLPPIPAAVTSGQAPTVFQTPGNVEIELPAKPISEPTTPTKSKGKSGKGLWLLLGLLLLAVLLYLGATLLSPGQAFGLLAGLPAPSSTPTAQPKIPTALPPSASPTLFATPTEIASATAAAMLPQATASETATAPATETETPIAIASPSGTSTPEVTADGTVSVSETPTATETPLEITSTATGEPESSPTPGVTPGTVKYPNGKRFKLFYDKQGIYLLNDSNEKRLLEFFSFERIDDAGQPLNRFDASHWPVLPLRGTPPYEVLHPIIAPKNCAKIEVSNPKIYPARPAVCENLTTSKRIYEPGHEYLFWTPQESSHFFRVLWKDEEVALCEISQGTCEVFIP